MRRYEEMLEPAVVVMRAKAPVDAEVLGRLVERANQPEAGPPIAIEVVDGRVVFSCATWRPILVARLEDAIEAELGSEQEVLERER